MHEVERVDLQTVQKLRTLDRYIFFFEISAVLGFTSLNSLSDMPSILPLWHSQQFAENQFSNEGG